MKSLLPLGKLRLAGAVTAKSQIISVDFNVGGSVTLFDDFGGSPASSVPRTGRCWNGFNIAAANQFSPGSFTSTQTLALTGLAANTNYELYFNGTNAKYDSDSTTFDVTPAYSTSGVVVSRTIINLGTQTLFVLGETYNAFIAATSTTLKSNLSGNIVFSWVNAGMDGAFNGFQLVTIPEPSAAIVIGLFLPTPLMSRMRCGN